MRMMSLALAAALCVTASPLAAQVVADAGVQSIDARLEARLAADARQPVRALIDSARGRGLPVEPLVQMALEGASRGADAARIVRAVASLAERLGAARDALGQASTETELVAAAGALRVGVPNA